jgi:hypothetical protein
MDIKIVVFTLFFGSILNSFSQLQIHPVLGVSYNGNQIVEGKNQYIDAVKGNRSDLDEGFLVTKKLKNNYMLGCGLTVGSLGNGVRLKYGINADGYSQFKYFTWKNLYLFSLNLGKETHTFNFFKEKNVVRLYDRDDNIIRSIQKYYLRFSIIPYLGFSYNIVQKKGNEYNIIDGYSVSNGDGYKIKSFVGANHDYILKSHGISLQTGTRIQFKRNEKNMFCLHLLLNISLQKYYENNVMYKLEEKPSWFSAKFITRGHFFGIYASYPITILNKKGERYRDRHPKTQ